MEEIRFELDCDLSSSHFHDEIELVYVLSGRIAVMVHGSNFILEPEDIIVFNPYEYHAMYREAGNHTLSVYIPSWIIQQEQIKTIRCCSYIQKEDKDHFELLRSRLANLFKEYRDKQFNHRLHVMSRLYGLLALLKQQFEIKDIEEGGSDIDTERMRKVLHYIDEHFSEDISLQSTADQVYLSKSYLSRVFQKRMGISFSDHLRKLRLNKAAWLLRSTEQPIIEIAMNCGFPRINTLILNFKQEYGETPSCYRKNHSVTEIVEYDALQSGEHFYMSLLKHSQYEENLRLLDKKALSPLCVRTDISVDGPSLDLCHQDAISIGWASELLMENVRNAVRRAAREIGFRYVHFHGLLDDSMDIYHETEDGRPYLSFTYLDMVFDFLVSLKVRPWMELGYTPKKLVSQVTNIFGESCINLPDDLGKWEFLIEGVIRHLLERYGEEQSRNWRFAVSNVVFAYYDVFSMSDYLEYYDCTYRSIRKWVPDADITGCTFSTEYIESGGEEKLVHFLEYCAQHQCMPDKFTFQCLQCDFTEESLKSVETRIGAGAGVQPYEPACISYDPDILKKRIRLMRKILDIHGAKGKPLVLDSWNSTAWQGDLGNDTCFKAAYIFKSYLENAGAIEGLVFCYLTDNSERGLTDVNVFHGGSGLMTYQGLPKAGYFAYLLLNRLESVVVAQGEGYIITRSSDKKKIRIGLYHYCHYNPETHISYALSIDEQRTCDRYYGFEDLGVKVFRFYLGGLEKGYYDKVSYSVKREHGSSYDAWLTMGAPNAMTHYQYEYLERIAIPDYRYERVKVEDTGELLIPVVLDTHEVRVISIEKK